MIFCAFRTRFFVHSINNSANTCDGKKKKKITIFKQIQIIREKEAKQQVKMGYQQPMKRNNAVITLSQC